MDFEHVIHKRKSVREFKRKKPSWKDVLDAIDLANQGPFANNDNHLKYLIIEEESTINSIAKSCEQTWIKNSRLLIVVLSDDTHLENIFGEKGRVYSRQQAGAAIHTLQLALTERGIDSCWVGSYSDDLLKAKLNIPQHIQIEAIIPLGFELGKSKKPAKKSLERCTFWEEFGKSKRPGMFDEATDDFGLPIDRDPNKTEL
jgi:nitroreductase